jgi:hypothetical protein
MNKLLPLFAAIAIFFSISVQAQINAGAVPAGMSIHDPGIDWTLTQSGTDSIRAIDVDCDGQPDLNFRLHKGAPVIDSPNYTILEIINQAFEVCMDTLSQAYFERPEYYNLNDFMDCSTGVSWTDSIRLMGDLGTFTAAGPSVITDQYIAFRKGAQYGWVKVTFDITDQGSNWPVTMQINEIIQFCNPISVDELDKSFAVTLSPNPTTDGAIQVTSDVQFVRAEIINITGQTVSTQSGTNNALKLPAAAGIYFVKLETATGQTAVRKVIRR